MRGLRPPILFGFLITFVGRTAGQPDADDICMQRLMAYGHLQPGGDYKDALGNFEEYFDLNRTESCTGETFLMLCTRPRCGNPEFKNNPYDPASPSAPYSNFDLTARPPGSATVEMVTGVFENAINLWTAADSRLSISTVLTGEANITFKFVAGLHPDPNRPSIPFLGLGNDDAHSFGPNPTEVHYDEGDHTTLTEVGLRTLTHDIGHAVGLIHSDNPDSLMYPYRPLLDDPDVALHPSDVTNLRNHISRNLPPTTESPTTEEPTESPTTEAPTTDAPTSEEPTEYPTTEGPTTDAPTTDASTAQSPTDETTEAAGDGPTQSEPPSTESSTSDSSDSTTTEPQTTETSTSDSSDSTTTEPQTTESSTSDSSDSTTTEPQTTESSTSDSSDSTTTEPQTTEPPSMQPPEPGSSSDPLVLGLAGGGIVLVILFIIFVTLCCLQLSRARARVLNPEEGNIKLAMGHTDPYRPFMVSGMPARTVYTIPYYR